MSKVLEKFASLSLGARWAVAIGIMALIGATYFYWLYLPASEELAALRAKRDQVQARLAESRRAAAELPKFKEDVLRLNQELLVALAQLPEEKEIPDLLAQVSRVGQESGLEVLSFRPGPEQRSPAGLYASIPVAMRVNGSFHQALVFFDRVSRLPRIVTISDVTLGEPKEVNSRFNLSVNFNATTYRFLPAATATSPGQARPGAKGTKRGS